ncbi:unnamed protein product, partial [Mesorhabditis belari]|uniref:Uncharacterized protein n=1 Tax=Mesorhabditis belari TaxID=2138241 RepID=A0AAF3J4H6_9BILA
MSATGGPMWVWRPNKIIESEPQSEDYRCCCGGFSTERCFTVVILLNLVSLGVLFIDLFIGNNKAAPGNWVDVFLQVLVVVLAVLAINTKRPFYMQIFWIFQLINRVFTIILHILVMIALALLYSKMPETEEKKHDKEHILHILIAYSLFFFCFALPVSIWMITFVYSYYCYIRDLQLWNEQQDDRAPLTV